MMSEHPSILQFIRENKTILILIGAGLFLIELEIFAIAAMRSGREARLQVLNNRGDLIYEADGKQLTEFNKYYFENASESRSGDLVESIFQLRMEKRK